MQLGQVLTGNDRCGRRPTSFASWTGSTADNKDRKTERHHRPRAEALPRGLRSIRSTAFSQRSSRSCHQQHYRVAPLGEAPGMFAQIGHKHDRVAGHFLAESLPHTEMPGLGNVANASVGV